MNKAFAKGAITIDAANRMEYLRLIQTHEEQGYDFIVMNDARTLRYGMLGLAGGEDPLVWLTLAMAIHHSADLDAEVPSESDGGHSTCVAERFASITEYYREYHHHKTQDCGLIDLTDTLSIRPAFLCRTCHVIVRADHDECIDLALALAAKRLPRARDDDPYT